MTAFWNHQSHCDQIWLWLCIVHMTEEISHKQQRIITSTWWCHMMMSCFLRLFSVVTPLMPLLLQMRRILRWLRYNYCSFEPKKKAPLSDLPLCHAITFLGGAGSSSMMTGLLSAVNDDDCEAALFMMGWCIYYHLMDSLLNIIVERLLTGLFCVGGVQRELWKVKSENVPRFWSCNNM